jgi:hypothetical protein
MPSGFLSRWRLMPSVKPLPSVLLPSGCRLAAVRRASFLLSAACLFAVRYRPLACFFPSGCCPSGCLIGDGWMDRCCPLSSVVKAFAVRLCWSVGRNSMKTLRAMQSSCSNLQHLSRHLFNRSHSHQHFDRPLARSSATKLIRSMMMLCHWAAFPAVLGCRPQSRCRP